MSNLVLVVTHTIEADEEDADIYQDMVSDGDLSGLEESFGAGKTEFWIQGKVPERMVENA